jgi:hypothetical protein
MLFKKKKQPCQHDWEYVPGMGMTDYDILKMLQKCLPVVVDRKAQELNKNGDPIWDADFILITYPGTIVERDNWAYYGVRVCLKCHAEEDQVDARIQEWTDTICEAEERESKRIHLHFERQSKAKEIYNAIHHTR